MNEPTIEDSPELLVKRIDTIIHELYLLRQQVARYSDQDWFWDDEWQALEAEAEADLKEGRVAVFDDVESLITFLDSGAANRPPPSLS
jgi:hypothetical protein